MDLPSRRVERKGSIVEQVALPRLASLHRFSCIVDCCLPLWCGFQQVGKIQATGYTLQVYVTNGRNCSYLLFEIWNAKNCKTAVGMAFSHYSLKPGNSFCSIGKWFSTCPYLVSFLWEQLLLAFFECLLKEIQENQSRIILANKRIK